MYQSEFNSNKFLTNYFDGKTVKSLCPDDGKLWITTSRDGIFIYDPEKEDILPVDFNSLISDQNVGYIRCSNVFKDSDGDYWLTFTDKYRVICCSWDGKRLRAKDTVFFLSPIAIAEDNLGRIWIGGVSNQLLRYDKKSKKTDAFEVYKAAWTFVTNLLPVEAGRMLVSAFGMPIFSINTYTGETTEEDLAYGDFIKRSILIPNKLFKDSNNDIWIGTVANGLIHSKTVVKESESISDISCTDICSIEEDRQGNIWISTMNGLGKYDRTSGECVNYFEEDGIGGNQFSDRASCILDDGTLVFGGTHGITWFNPLDLTQRRQVPLVFQYLKVHNHLVSPSEHGPIDKVLSMRPDITLKSSENGFSISFAALDYSDLPRIHYQYKMEGFDRYWVDAGTSHEAYYANMPSGKYRFRVRIGDNSGSIIPAESYLNVRVLPPWHATWWAILLWILLGILFVGIFYTFYRHIHRVRKEAAARIREVRREREKAEEAEKAEKALNKIQKNYFANVAHEFRTPLTMIAGPAQQLSSSKSISGQDRQLVNIIRRNTTWMLSLVNQLLDFNRIGNSKLQMKVTKLDIVKPLRETAELFRYNSDSKGIELSTYGLEDSFTMWADVDKVQKIVMNLLSNAMKFTPSGGKVTLSFDVIPRGDAAALFPLNDTDQDGQWAKICVSDSGPGIHPDELEQIFERFYQAADGKKSYGSGIGLYYARALAGFHHGYIKAWNRPEGGAEFGLVLPVSASSYTEDERSVETPVMNIPSFMDTQQETTSANDSSKKSIAVVDDDIDIGNYLKILLSPQYKVTLYFDGSSAMKGMAEEAPDLIISDVVMPGMDGYELCSQIKGDLQLSHIPVVLVTAKVAVESQVQGLGKGADAYVTKPFQPEYLLALVKSLLENREKLHKQLGSVTTTEEIAPETLSPRDAAFMKELYGLMESELANADLDIVKMAEMMKISRTKFYYKVKGLTGENPSVFFKRYKLNRAAALLKEGKNNMSEIAWMTGFNTLSHFSTSFKKQFGVSPSEYKG